MSADGNWPAALLPRMQGRGDHFVFQQKPEGAICSPVARSGLRSNLTAAASSVGLRQPPPLTWSPVATTRCGGDRRDGAGGVACRTCELGYFHHERLNDMSMMIHVRMHAIKLPLQRTPLGGKIILTSDGADGHAGKQPYYH